MMNNNESSIQFVLYSTAVLVWIEFQKLFIQLVHSYGNTSNVTEVFNIVRTQNTG